MCHTVPWLVPFTWQCVIQYHDQCLSPGNVSYSTTTSAFHLAMCHTVIQPVQYEKAPYGPRPVLYDNAPYGNTTSVFHMAICHTIPRPVSFTLQCVIRYHDQRLSHGTKVDISTPSSDGVFFFSDLRKLCDFLRIRLLKDDIEKKIKKIRKHKWQFIQNERML